MGNLKKSKYFTKRTQQTHGKFRPTSPFVRADDDEAAPILYGEKLRRAQDADERHLRWLFADPERLWLERRA